MTIVPTTSIFISINFEGNHNQLHYTIGNSETLFVTSFGGSYSASIIGSVTLPTIKVAILECVGNAVFETATFRFMSLYVTIVKQVVIGQMPNNYIFNLHNFGFSTFLFVMSLLL